MLEAAENQRLAIVLAPAPGGASTENVARDKEAPSVNAVNDPYLERSSNEVIDDHAEEEDDLDEGDDDIDDDEDDDEEVDIERIDSASLNVLGTLSSTAVRRKRVRKRRRVRNKRNAATPSTEGEDSIPRMAQNNIYEEGRTMTSASTVVGIINVTTPSIVGPSRGGSSSYVSNINNSNKNSNAKQQTGGPTIPNQKSKKPHDAPMTNGDLYYSIRCGMIQAEIDVVITSSTTNPSSVAGTTKRIVHDIIGRITLVNWDNKVVYDVFVIPQFSLSQQQQFKIQEQAASNMATASSSQQEKIEFGIHRILDYRTAITGITPQHYEQSKKDSWKEEFNLSTIEAAKPIVKKYIKGKILIGYNIPNDLGMIHDGITHPKRDLRDIAQFAPYMNTIVTARPMSFSVSQDKQQIVHLESIPLQRLMEQYTKDEPILKKNVSKKDYGILYQEAVGCMYLYKRLRSEWEDELCRLSRHKYKVIPILPVTMEHTDGAVLDPLSPSLVTPVVLSHQKHYSSSMKQTIPMQHLHHQHHQPPYTTSVSNQQVHHRGVVNLLKQPSTGGSLSSTVQQHSPYYHHSHGMTILPSSTSLSYSPKASLNEGQWHHPVYAHPQHQTWNSMRPEEQYQVRDDRVLEAQEPPLSIPSSRRYYNQGQYNYHSSLHPPDHRISTTPRMSHLSPRRSDGFDVDYAERTSTMKINDYHHHTGMNYSPHSLSEALRQKDADNGHYQRQRNSFTNHSVPMDPWTSQLPSRHPHSTSRENDLALFNDRNNNLPTNESANENPEYPLPIESYLPSDSSSWSPLLHDNFSLLSLLDNDSTKTPSVVDSHRSNTSREATTARNKVDTIFQWDTLLTSIQKDADVNSNNHFH